MLEVDINSIHEKGYSLETPVLVTNADDYADVIEMASGSVKAGAPLLTGIKIKGDTDVSTFPKGFFGVAQLLLTSMRVAGMLMAVVRL